jgi:hypothetical protein
MNTRKGLSMAVIGAAFLALTVVPTASAMRRTGVIVRRLYPYYPYYADRYYGPAWYYPGRYASTISLYGRGQNRDSPERQFHLR